MAAVASYLAARSRQGEWLIRIEDLDTPRVAPGAADAILSTLDAYGFEADGQLLFQSDRLPLYEEILHQLRDRDLLYPCSCSRKEIADSVLNRSTTGEVRYPGTCRTGLNRGRPARSWRLRVPNEAISWQDRLQGASTSNLEADLGDFILARADGLVSYGLISYGIVSYQLAVVVDDAAQGITEVVRGADLLDSTPRQIYLHRCLNISPPAYLHIPVATGPNGDKLSKQNLAQPLTAQDASQNLFRALHFLGQQPPNELLRAPLSELWPWAVAHWRESLIPAALCRQESSTSVRVPKPSGNS